MYKKLFILLILTAIYSCNTTEPIEDNTPLIPLNVGNYWLYQGYDLDPDSGNMIMNSIAKNGFIITQTPSNISNQYQMCLCGDNKEPIDDTNFSLYGGNKLVYENQNGFYYSGIVRKDTVVMTFNDLIFPRNVKKGDKFSGHVFFYSIAGNYLNVPDEVTTKYTCVSTDSLFATPLGNFRCIVYKMAYDDFPPLFRGEVYYFLKPGIGIIGMVQMVYHYSLDKYSFFYKAVLFDYKIK